MATTTHPSFTYTTPKVDFGKHIDTSSLRGKTAVVTGGANGWGALLVRRLCAEGALVMIADLQAGDGEKLADELRVQGQMALYQKTDVTSWPSIVSAFKTTVTESPFRSIDIVIPCAGLPGIALPEAPNEASLEKDPPPPSLSTLDVTLKGVYYTVLVALYYFRLPEPQANGTARQKQIIFIGSLSSYVELPPTLDYSAAKLGVRGLWKSLRWEVREQGVRTNFIAPTFLATPMIEAVKPLLLEKGAKLANLDDAVDAVLRCACNEDIVGRAIAVGGHGNFDLRDDSEGYDGGIEVLRYFESGAFGAGMHIFKEILAGRVFNEQGRPISKS